MFVHELGHFVAAKKMGVRVDEFGLGFPPKLIGIRKGETLYSLNLLPLGGFVRIKGETGEDKDDPDSFSHKKIWQRSIILFSGVAMNFVTAIILVAIGFMIGLPLPLDDAESFAKAKISDPRIQVVSILKDSPAEQADLAVGDVILKINDQSFAELEQLQGFLEEREGAVSVVVKRGQEELARTIETKRLAETGKFGLGVGLVKSGIVSFPWHLALWHGLERSVFITKEVVIAFYTLFKNLIVGQQIAVDVSGPVGIAIITGQVTKLGFVYILQFMALLSINLAVINILPFPALDGSRLFFLAVEKIRRKQLDRRVESLIHTFGFSVLILLMVFITYRDVVKYGGDIWSLVSGFFS